MYLIATHILCYNPTLVYQINVYARLFLAKFVSYLLSTNFAVHTSLFGTLEYTVNIHLRCGIGMIVGNTFVILVYRYKFSRYVHQIIIQMPIRYVLKYL